MSSKKYCQECGSPSDLSAKFCGNCGESLTVSVASKRNKLKNAISKRRNIRSVEDDDEGDSNYNYENLERLDYEIVAHKEKQTIGQLARSPGSAKLVRGERQRKGRKKDILKELTKEAGTERNSFKKNKK